MSKTSAFNFGPLWFGMSAFLVISLYGCEKDDEASHGPQETQPVHEVTFEGLGVDLDVSGSYLSIAAKQNGITLFETTSPSHPLPIAELKLPLVYKTLLQKGAIFAFDEKQGLGFVAIRDLETLKLVPSLSTVELYGFIHDAIWTESSLIFASDATGLSSYTVDPNLQLRNPTHPIPESLTQGVNTIALVGSQLVAAAYQGGISAYEWSENGPPILTGTSPTKHPISDMDCANDFCYVAGLGHGLFVYDLQAADPPELIYEIALDKAIDLILVDEELIYASALGTGTDYAFYIFSRNDLAAPRLLKSIAVTSPIKDFTRVGEFLYVLLEDGRMPIYARGSLP